MPSYKTNMLRISHDQVTADRVRLRIEGRMIGPWVAEVRRSCEPFVGHGRRLTLDLTAVTFADREGVTLLRELAGRGADLRCSPFLRELLGVANGKGRAGLLPDTEKL